MKKKKIWAYRLLGLEYCNYLNTQGKREQRVEYLGETIRIIKTKTVFVIAYIFAIQNICPKKAATFFVRKCRKETSQALLKTYPPLTSSNPLFKKSRIRETKNLSTDADSRTDTILERLHDLSKKNTKTLLFGSFFDRYFWGPLLAATFRVLF